MSGSYRIARLELELNTKKRTPPVKTGYENRMMEHRGSIRQRYFPGGLLR